MALLLQFQMYIATVYAISTHYKLSTTFAHRNYADLMKLFHTRQPAPITKLVRKETNN